MDNNSEILENQQNISAEQQQKAFYDAMQQIKEDEQKRKKAKRKKKLIVLGAILGVFVLFIAGTILSVVLFPEKAIGNAAVSSYYNVSYIVNENTNETRDSYLENVDKQIDDFVGNNDIKDERIQKKLYKQGKRAFEEEAYLGAIQIWEKCAGYKDTKELLKEANYKAGLLYEENKSFSFAASHFEDSNGFSDSDKRAVECNYQHFLLELNEGKYSVACLYAETFVLKKLDNENVRKAYLWGLVQMKCQSTISSVESAVRSACKDPSSYYGIDTDAHFNFTENKRSSTHGYLSVEVNHTYSATNSYGGRLTDTYSYTTKKEEFSLQGMTYEEAYRVACLSISALLAECGFKG